MKVKLISLKSGDKYIDHLACTATVISIGEAFPCVEGYDYHCAKGEKFNYTISKHHAWQSPDDEDIVYNLSAWVETEVEVIK